MNTEIKIEIIAITPEIAEEFLQLLNPETQRKYKPHVAAGYAADMTAGRWMFSNDAICFDVDGSLVNGQHRLRAIVKSGATEEFMIIHGMSREAILTMDIGTSRTVTDQLNILGIPNGTNLRSIARLVMLYRSTPDKVWSVGPTTREVTTDPAIVLFIVNNQESLHAALLAGKQANKKWRINPAALSALGFLVEKHSDSSYLWDEDFLPGLLSAANLKEQDARIALMNYSSRPKPPGTGWGAGQSNLFLMIKVWNKYVKEQQITKLNTPRRSELPMPKVL